MSQEIANGILNFNLRLTDPVEFYRSDLYIRDSLSDWIDTPSISPFDNLNCYPSLLGAQMSIKDNVYDKCLHLQVNSDNPVEYIRNIESISSRVDLYLNNSIDSTLFSIEFGNLELSLSGVSIIPINTKCEKKYTHGYLWSKIYTNISSNKLVVYSYYFGHEEEYSILYFIKIGESWHLFTKEIV